LVSENFKGFEIKTLKTSSLFYNVPAKKFGLWIRNLDINQLKINSFNRFSSFQLIYPLILHPLFQQSFKGDFLSRPENLVKFLNND